MLKLLFTIGAGILAFVAPATAAEAALGPDAASCRPGSDSPAALVSVTGFKNRAGNLRLHVYGSDPAAFLAKGKKLKRIDLPVTGAGPMRVCVAMPRAGNYAIVVHHDTDGNRKKGWNDGGGFSRNPDISLAHLKPKYQQVAFGVGNGIKPLEVVLNYRRGLSIGPVGRN